MTKYHHNIISSMITGQGDLDDQDDEDVKDDENYQDDEDNENEGDDEDDEEDVLEEAEGGVIACSDPGKPLPHCPRYST